MRSFLFAVMLMFSTMLMAKDITLTKDNTLVLNDAFSGKSVSELIGQAKSMDAGLQSGYPIYLFLNTPGGSIQAGIELIEYLNGLNRPVHTVTLFAASMGWQLAQHLGKRYVLKYGILMSHKAYGGFQAEFGGSSSQMDSRYGLWLRRLNMMDQQTVDRTGGKKTLQQYQSEYDNELWLNGGEAVKNGYADEVVNVKCGGDLVGSTDKEIVFFGMKIQLTFDKCPIRTYPTDVVVNVRTNKGYMPLNKFMETGGIFGKNCRREGATAKTDWQGNVIGEGEKAQLCLMDQNLTLEDIEKKVESEKLKIKNSKKNVIKMNFGNFVSEI